MLRDVMVASVEHVQAVKRRMCQNAGGPDDLDAMILAYRGAMPVAQVTFLARDKGTTLLALDVTASGFDADVLILTVETFDESVPPNEALLIEGANRAGDHALAVLRYRYDDAGQPVFDAPKVLFEADEDWVGVVGDAMTKVMAAPSASVAAPRDAVLSLTRTARDLIAARFLSDHIECQVMLFSSPTEGERIREFREGAPDARIVLMETDAFGLPRVRDDTPE